MSSHAELRMEPGQETLAATRAWLEPVRNALGPEFLAAYLTGSVLTQGFDPAHSRVNVLVVARALDPATLDAVRAAIPATRKPPHIDPLFMTRAQIENSLDVFPIEWLEICERHLLVEGESVVQELEVPQTYLRLQCEHELRGKHIRLRQAYLLSAHEPAELAQVLKGTASSFATLFRTLIRLRGETPPADTTRMVERLSQLYGLDAEAALGAHRVRYATHRYREDELLPLFRRFLAQVDRLVTAIDQLRVR